jgi:hypothetical protein
MRFLFYTVQWWIFISAMLNRNISLLLLSIVGMLVGIVWAYPLFPEDMNDKKL